MSLQEGLAHKKCIAEIRDKAIMLAGSQNETYFFDHISGEGSTQEEIFAVVGKPIVDQCLHGYNGSIFAYG